MEIVKAKMKSLTKSYGEDEATILEYVGQEGILINNQNRKFVFDSEEGKIFVFISTQDPLSIKEKFNDSEIYIEFNKSNKGYLDMKRKFGSRFMSARFEVIKDIFKVKDNLIHIKYKILDENTSSYLSVVEIFIETGGN